MGSDPEIFLHRQAGEDAPALGHERDAQRHDLVGRAAADGPAVEAHGRRRARVQPDHGPEERRFAGAIRADDGHELAWRDLERDAEEGLEIAVEGGELVDRQEAHPTSIPM